MNHMILKSLCILALCTMGFTTANASELTKAEQQKYLQVCKSKSQGAMVSFAHQGVIYNGSCETGADGKLIFQPPMPKEGTIANTQNQISETQSEPRPVAPETPAPMAPQSAPSELSPPIVAPLPVTDPMPSDNSPAIPPSMSPNPDPHQMP